MKKSIFSLLIALILVSQASAVFVSDINSDDITPGREGSISIKVENDLDDPIEDVSVRLDLTNLPFSSVGSSEDSIDEIEDDEEESFSFTIKASNDVEPGDYQIPFILSYSLQDSNATREQKGSFGVSVSGDVDLAFTATADTPVVGQQTEVTLRMVNKGLADARFVTVRALPNGFTLLSDPDVYIGEVASDDFETATFNVLFNRKNPTFEAEVEYRDFENNIKTEQVNIPMKVYSREEAIELGIIKKSNIMLIVVLVVLVIAAWIIWRYIRRRQRLKRSMERR